MLTAAAIVLAYIIVIVGGALALAYLYRHFGG